MGKEPAGNRKGELVTFTATDVPGGHPKLGTPSLRKRPNLTVRLTAKLYREIQEAANQAGRSLSEEVERRLERAAEWDAVFEFAAQLKAKFKADHEALERDDTEAALARRGYMKVFDARFGGHAWLPPGQLPMAHEQIVRQAEQPARKAAEVAAKETPIKQQLEDMKRQIHSLLLAVQKGE